MRTGAAPLLGGPFCFLRHGETEHNRLALVAGATDVPLNAKGLAQAQAAAGRLAASGIDAIWCSPLQRARDTARCVAGVLGIEPVIVAELAERNWGELEGQPRALRVREATPPGGESPEEFRARTLKGLQKIGASRMPLIVAHSGTFRVLSAWLDLPPQEAPVPNSLPLLLNRTADGRWHSSAF
ncbi:MAG: histidine phosphatase family protein [Burkholderiales bacterium]|nr:histidine phosphatase family protein [Burkholderiales bacterium]